MAKQQTDASRILRDHTEVGPSKPVSYLPLQTLEQVIGITINAYKSVVERSGNQCVVLDAEECCIKSGAVYAYSEIGLSKILNENADLLRRHNWPTTSAKFVRRIGSQWLDEENPVLPIIRRAFGDEPGIWKR